MKKLILVVLALSCVCSAQIKFWTPSGGGGTGTSPQFVNSAAGSTTFASSSAIPSASFNAQAGNLLAVYVTVNAADLTGVSVTDAAGNTYTLAVSDLSSTVSNAIYYAKNITGNAANVVTLHTTGTTYSGLVVYQISGASTTAPLDQTFTKWAGYGPTSLTTDAFTTTAANELIFAGVTTSAGQNLTPGTGYTISGNLNPSLGIAAEYKVVTSIQTGVTLAFTGDTVSTWNIVGATFK